MNKVSKTLCINGLMVDAAYYLDDIEQRFLPLLRQLDQRYIDQKKRIIVLMAAPPGTGKSTLVEFFHDLANEYHLHMIQGVGMDGFHYKNAYLKSHYIANGDDQRPLMCIKGAPITFDVMRLKDHLIRLSHENVVWPIYSRLDHDVNDQGILIDAPIVIIEGNYLLLDQPPWSSLRDHVDLTISIKADIHMLKENIIKRKIEGGYNINDALHHFETVDRPNIELVLDHSCKADIEWVLDHDGHFRSIDK